MWSVGQETSWLIRSASKYCRLILILWCQPNVWQIGTQKCPTLGTEWPKKEGRAGVKEGMSRCSSRIGTLESCSFLQDGVAGAKAFKSFGIDLKSASHAQHITISTHTDITCVFLRQQTHPESNICIYPCPDCLACRRNPKAQQLPSLSTFRARARVKCLLVGAQDQECRFGWKKAWNSSPLLTGKNMKRILSISPKVDIKLQITSSEKRYIAYGWIWSLNCIAKHTTLKGSEAE